MKNNNQFQTSHRFAILAKLGEVIFHIDDLANLWQVKNKNTLYTTLKRYAQHGKLIRIYKGFYSLINPDKIDPLLLGLKALHNYAYVGCETMLIEYGIIQQTSATITLTSSSHKRFSVNENNYLVRKLPVEFLFNSIGIITTAIGIRKSNLARSVADMLYFNPQYYFDNANRIDWKRVKSIQKEIGYPLTPTRYV